MTRKEVIGDCELPGIRSMSNATGVVEYITPHYELTRLSPVERDQDMFSVPRWVLGVLAEELTARSGCGGVNDQPGCAMCDAIRVAREASEFNA